MITISIHLNEKCSVVPGDEVNRGEHRPDHVWVHTELRVGAVDGDRGVRGADLFISDADAARSLANALLDAAKKLDLAKAEHAGPTPEMVAACERGDHAWVEYEGSVLCGNCSAKQLAEGATR